MTTYPTSPLEAIGADGAFEIGGGDFNFGQGYTESLIRDLFEVPMPTSGNAIEILQDQLKKLPLEALLYFKQLIPGTVDDDFIDVATSVTTIIDNLGNLPKAMLVGDFNAWLSTTFSGLEDDVQTALANSAQALKDLLTGVTGASDSDVTNWISGLGGGDGSGIISPDRLPMIPISHIGQWAADLLPNGDLDGAVSIDGNGEWVFDPAVFESAAGRTAPGSARTTADGTQKELLSEDLIYVTEGQVISVTGFIKHSNLTSTGNPLEIGLQTYSDLKGAVPVSRPLVAAPTAPTGTSGWLPVSGTYTVPAGVKTVRARLTVLPAATAGDVFFDRVVPNKTGLLAKELVDGLVSQLQDLADLSQDIIKNAWEAMYGPFVPTVDKPALGLPDLKDALNNIPSTHVGGVEGMSTMQTTVKTMWDTVTSALKRTGVSGVSLGDFAAAAQDTAESAVTANALSVDNYNVLGVRTNRGVMGGMERTTISNLNLDCLGSGASPLNFAVTQAASSMAFLRMPERDTKGVIYWLGSGNANISAFYVSLGKMDLAGNVTPLFTSANLYANLTSGWSWQSYTFPGANQIAHASSEVLVVEFVVVGTGSHLIAGVSQSWMPLHPAATTKKGAATRNTAGGAPALDIAAGSVVFSGNVPYVGMGRSSVPADYIPPEVEQRPNSGAFSYDIPSWMVTGDILDVFAIGSGGGGQAGGYGLAGEGGAAGEWQTRSLVYGVDIPLSTKTITGSVGGAASGGINPYTLDPGDNGNPTTVVIPGYGTITAAGGPGGGRAGNDTQSVKGQAAGNRTIDGYTAFGGTEVGQNQYGNPPGGGGGSGYPASGFSSGKGKVWFRARQG